MENRGTSPRSPVDWPDKGPNGTEEPGLAGLVQGRWLGTTGMLGGREKGGGVSSSCTRPVGRLRPGSPGSCPDHRCAVVPAREPINPSVWTCECSQVPLFFDWSAFSAPLAYQDPQVPLEAGYPCGFFPLRPPSPFWRPLAARVILVVCHPRSAIRQDVEKSWSKSGKGEPQLPHLSKVPLAAGSGQPNVEPANKVVVLVTCHTNAFLSH
jgi:hypothetical protein